MDLDKLIAELKRDEGIRFKPYHCSAGKLTIGIGRNLDNVGISLAEAELMLRNDIARMEIELDQHLPWWRSLDPVRQRVLLNMAFNIGVVENDGKLLTFVNTLRLIQLGSYEAAADNMLASKWAKQVGSRALRLSRMMRDGVDPSPTPAG